MASPRSVQDFADTYDGRRVQGRIAVIGAGVAGVATASALKACQLEFVVYDKRPGVGGVWFQNYPGASGRYHCSHCSGEMEQSESLI
jgi:cation diffusion facilitator CzcD-associated flavoprotein CzcO